MTLVLYYVIVVIQVKLAIIALHIIFKLANFGLGIIYDTHKFFRLFIYLHLGIFHARNGRNSYEPWVRETTECIFDTYPNCSLPDQRNWNGTGIVMINNE